MIVARVGGTSRCAQFIAIWIRQLAAPSPSAATSHTLGATLVEVVSPPSAPPGRIEATAGRGAEAGSRAVLLGSAPARDQAQLWTWSLAAGDRYDAEPDPAGWHEMVFVTAGRLRIEREDEVAVVDAGDYAIYSSAQRYSYVNDAAGTTTFLRNVVS